MASDRGIVLVGVGVWHNIPYIYSGAGGDYTVVKNSPGFRGYHSFTSNKLIIEPVAHEGG